MCPVDSESRPDLGPWLSKGPRVCNPSRIPRRRLTHTQMPARDLLYDSCTYVHTYVHVHESPHPNGAPIIAQEVDCLTFPGLASGNSGGRPSRLTGPSFADRGGLASLKPPHFVRIASLTQET